MQDIDKKKEEFDRFGCAVLLVSFVGDEGAKKWREEIGVEEARYPFLLDEDRRLYQQ